MDWLTAVWDWLKNPDNRAVLTLIGGAVAAVAWGGWEVYKFRHNAQSVQSAARSNGSTPRGMRRDQAVNREPSDDALLTPVPLLPARPSIHGWSAHAVQDLQRQTALALPAPVERRDPLTDGSQGPVVRVIPAGEFLMGSPEHDLDRYDAEEPQHPVVIAAPFGMGCYAVTFDEYDRFCDVTGRAKPDDEGWGRRRRPVINVTWHDAVAYCAWLSQETGATYRLPSEAEWEYAARAGTTTAYWWGAEIDAHRANYYGSQRGKTVPVDAFQPNPFGLYQVHGNVGEWVQDHWHSRYQGAPRDGAAWEDADAGAHRVLRGGSWGSLGRRVRTANRRHSDPNRGNNRMGFRCVRVLE